MCAPVIPGNGRPAAFAGRQHAAIGTSPEPARLQVVHADEDDIRARSLSMSWSPHEAMRTVDSPRPCRYHPAGSRQELGISTVLTDRWMQVLERQV